jgi:hypothetical protein
MDKDKDPHTDPDPYLWLMDSDSDPGDQKPCGSVGSGLPILVKH